MTTNKPVAELPSYIVLVVVVALVLGVSTFVIFWDPKPELRRPVWSPTGNYIAVECSYGGWEYLDYEICLLPIDRSTSLRLNEKINRPSTSFLHPSWSPDGGRLAFEGPLGLFVASIPQREVEEILKMQVSCADPQWSPDGSQLVCEFGWGGQGLILITLSESEHEVLTTHEQDQNPIWVLQGRSVAFVRWDGVSEEFLYVIDISTRREQLLVSGLGPETPAIDISPDGNEIVYPNQGKLYLFNLETMVSRELLLAYRDCFENIAYPSWSHNGEQIAFTGERSSGQFDRRTQVWVVDISSKKVFQVTNEVGLSPHDIGPPSWSPDDAQIATSYNDDIMIISVEDASLAHAQCE